MKKIIPAMLVALILAGCNDPKSVALPSKPADWGPEVAEAAKQLTEEDRKLLAAYAVRGTIGAAFGGVGIPPGTTIGSAIKAQKEWVEEQNKAEAEREILKQKLEAEQQAFKKMVEESVTVSLMEKTLLPKDYDSRQYRERFMFKLGIENKSPKDIAGIRGSIKFYDIFGSEVDGIGFSFDDGLKAGKSTIWIGTRDYNQFIDKDKKLANLDEGKYTTKFFPEMIVFSDGTKLTVSKDD